MERRNRGDINKPVSEQAKLKNILFKIPLSLNFCNRDYQFYSYNCLISGLIYFPGGTMTDKAIILIPDISGFTDFITKNELDHSSHIINELLDLIISRNSMGFYMSEIEGDAVLFYKKGGIPSRTELVNQCLEMFSAFQQQLKYIERDVVCRCGACQTASNLSLKFIVHYGTIKEFHIANIIKASGIDMIIAHRLLKNNISSKEYILFTSACTDYFTDKDNRAGLTWNEHTESYPAIGEIKVEYADLDNFRRNLPGIPERKSYIQHDGGDTLELEIEAPIEEVYQKLIDIDLLPEWMVGVTGVKREPVVERIGTRHTCMTSSFDIEVELDYAEFRGDNAIVVNKFEIKSAGISGIGADYLRKIDERRTNITDTSMWDVPEEIRQEMLKSAKMSLEYFKALCEGKEVKKEPEMS
jgi:hypothetical protein